MLLCCNWVINALQINSNVFYLYQPLILYYWTMVMVLCYSLLGHWLLPRINALTLIHTLTHHWGGWFAGNGQPFICYSSHAKLTLIILSHFKFLSSSSSLFYLFLFLLLFLHFLKKKIVVGESMWVVTCRPDWLEFL